MDYFEIPGEDQLCANKLFNFFIYSNIFKRKQSYLLFKSVVIEQIVLLLCYVTNKTML